MTPPLTPQPDRPLEPTAAAKTTSTHLFGVLYITLTGLVDSMVPNSRPWSLLGQSVSYIIKLAPILWWALPDGLAVPHPEPTKASTYNWLPDIDTNIGIDTKTGAISSFPHSPNFPLLISHSIIYTWQYTEIKISFYPISIVHSCLGLLPCYQGDTYSYCASMMCMEP
ncbi:hypothetical protein DSO57_1006622 [Entomophthora muscae]|uniref:Uncharacterized protein n=1 Tax=Entomophthora muscae TaxID=34485 RepID=A0ACC2T7R2_9FUNG|nr:hypothetical protein DSO57_1006622 [Entomophthora muscae]